MSTEQLASERSRDTNRLASECEKIRRQWHGMTGDAAYPDERKTSYLKKEIYRLVRQLAKRHKRPIDALAELEALGQNRRQHGSSQFLLITRLINLVVRDDLLAGEKRRYAVELNYAWRHRVPGELLVGFIWQVGGWKRIKKLEAEIREEWFDPKKHEHGIYRGHGPRKFR